MRIFLFLVYNFTLKKILNFASNILDINICSQLWLDILMHETLYIQYDKKKLKDTARIKNFIPSGHLHMKFKSFDHFDAHS